MRPIHYGFMLLFLAMSLGGCGRKTPLTLPPVPHAETATAPTSSAQSAATLSATDAAPTRSESKP